MTILPALLLGCAAGNANSDKTYKEPANEIVELKKSIADANARIEELNNKFLLLKERLETQGARHTSAAEEEEPSAPKGLKVVKLGDSGTVDEPEEPVKKTSKKPKAAKKNTSSALDIEALYNQGQNHFMAGNYETARAIFSELVAKAPESTFADNALYWIGESYYAERDYKSALTKFKDAYEKYPKENKAPDSMLKAALSLNELGNTDGAAETLNALINRYPDSPAADKAKRTLKKISHPN